MSGAERERCREAVCARLQRLREVTDARFLAVYAARADEVDLAHLIVSCHGQKRGILLPRFDSAAGCYGMVEVADIGTETVAGKFGIPEPLSHRPFAPAALVSGPDVTWLVPGLAFDESCRRLGRGRGYYDRLLQGTDGFRIGVTHDWRILPELPHSDHDVSMDLIVSEARVIRAAD